MPNPAPSHRIARALAAATMLLLVPLAASSGAVAPWMPHEVDDLWKYSAPGGGHQTKLVTGVTTLFGRPMAVVTYYEGLDSGLKNFLQVAPDGSVLLGGFLRPGEFGWLYDPPLVMLDAPPTLGKVWSSSTNVYDYDSHQLVMPLSVAYGVLEETDLVVPAGSFLAVGLGPPPPLATSADPLAGRSFTIDGRTRVGATRAAASGATDWYAQGVGVVRYEFGGPYQLESFGSATPVAGTTWGRLKRLYR